MNRQSGSAGLALQEVLDRLAVLRRRLGGELVILGHHYQRDDVIRFADVAGDSLKLARYAAERSEARWIVFCGVHFMAESADILRQPHQRVILPNPAAGCTMADMASAEQVRAAWALLGENLAGKTALVVYINSTAEVKAFAGERGGWVCTSSNAPLVLAEVFKQADRVLFLPDQHLGRYAGSQLGISPDQMPVWDPLLPPRDQAWAPFRSARLILWKGHCSIHQMFKTSHIKHFRMHEPERKIVVHPECAWEVVQAADEAGSTEAILTRVKGTAPGTRWAVGTEINLVKRLADAYPAGTVVPLTRFGALCPTMYRISPQHLLAVLEKLAAGAKPDVVAVPPAVAAGARAALDRMLGVGGGGCGG